jgi:Kef-type K+ transport system membrane component KefB
MYRRGVFDYCVPCSLRILTELKLLDTTVGIVVLSAGVGNEIGMFSLNFWGSSPFLMKHLVGWILLPLSVALVNASNGLTAIYILLACFGWTLFLVFPVKLALRSLARKTGSCTICAIPFSNRVFGFSPFL